MNHSIWWPAFVAVFLLFQLVAIPALVLKKNDFADVLWGPVFPLGAMAGVFWGLPGGFGSLGMRGWIVLGLVGAWAVRLVLHVGIRNLSHLREDVRYAKWRQEWGRTQVWRSYLQVWVLQPLIAYLFLTPVLVALGAEEIPLGVVFWLGVAVWLVGFLFEAIGDEQLRRHKADPTNKGKLITSGLWAWSRHPNYFGEVALWWGVFLCTLEVSGWWLGALGPIGVSYLLWSVSGVAMTEALMRRRPGFEEYAKRTSIFFPLPPRA